MTVEQAIPPQLILLAAGILVFLAPKRWRSMLFVIFSLVALRQVWQLNEGARFTFKIAGFQLSLLHCDSLSRVFAVIFALITLIGGIFSFHLQDRKELVAALFYASGAIGVTYAGDYFTLFIFWEFMAASSTYLVWSSGSKEGYKAGLRYLMAHLFGGGLLLAGILLHVSTGDSLAIGHLPVNGSLSSILILLGVILNAAVPPLHAWLTDAYPSASVGGAVFLSALTTKAAVYVLIRIFAGWQILLILGVMMSLYGIVYALLANDIRRILAYHIICQVGYMVAGVGIGTPIALNGAVAHAFNNILYKTLLFMGAGSVLYATGKSKLTELGGLARAMPLVVMLYFVGGFSISGFPLFNGFISKSMVITAASESHLQTAVLLLMLASIGTFLSICLKLPYFTWFYRKNEIPVRRLPVNMYIGMGIIAFFCLLFGIRPGLLYSLLPKSEDFQPYTLSHLVETTQILVFTFVAFWIFRKKFTGEPKIALDLDWFYRRPSRFMRRMLVDAISKGFTAVDRFTVKCASALTVFASNPLQYFFDRGAYSPDRYRPTVELLISVSLLVLVVLILLGIFLVK